MMTDETKPMGATRSEVARLGGQALVEQRGTMYMRELGRKGGQAVAARPGWMSAIGAKGGEATKAKKAAASPEAS